MSIIDVFSHPALSRVGDVCGSGMGSFSTGACPHLDSADSQLWSEPKYWSPWTHRPYCQGAWCVHTHAFVPCGQGISIITHRSGEHEAAATLDDLSQYSDEPSCAISAGGWTPASDNDSLRDKHRFYEVRNSKGKGKGVFATCKIPRGSIIMVDRPIMLKFEPETENDILSEFQRSLLFAQAATQLSNPGMVLGLAQHEGFTGSQAENAANYNSFQVDLGNGTYSAVFPRVSRINHACIPNCRAKWSSKTLTQTIWAVKEIQPGEELSISYIPMGPEWKWDHRQNELRENWNFACTCSLCSAETRTREASDERRQKFAILAQQYHRLNQYDTRASQQALHILEQAMEINMQEPMLTSAVPLLLQAAWTAYRGGHVGTAKGYVEKIEEDMRARGFKDEGDKISLNEIRGVLY